MRLLRGLIVLVALPILAQPAPEDCVAGKRDRIVETASHAGKTYQFKKAGCRELFESDPERYAQLFDALAELSESGEEVKAAEASLVPS